MVCPELHTHSSFPIPIPRSPFPIPYGSDHVCYGCAAEEDSSHTPQKPPKHGEPNLHDIEELDEDVSSSSGMVSVLPPSSLTLERQFVESGLYSVALQWTPPHPLPAGATGYCVYVNGDYKCDVSGADQHGILLTGIQRQQVRGEARKMEV